MDSILVHFIRNIRYSKHLDVCLLVIYVLLVSDFEVDFNIKGIYRLTAIRKITGLKLIWGISGSKPILEITGLKPIQLLFENNRFETILDFNHRKVYDDVTFL